MSLISQFQAAQKFLKEAGINLESIMDLFSGKATPRKIAQVLTPILIKVSPGIGHGMKHLEKEAGEKRYLVISLEHDQNNIETEAISVGRINEEGQMEVLETIPFYQMAKYIVDTMEGLNSVTTIAIEESQPKQLGM
jgi:hypothetical protein